VGNDDRNEKIRTCYFPQNHVSDHRLNLTDHRLEQVLDGDLDEFIDALIARDQAEKLKESPTS
jgi:peptide chain release factor 1